MSTEQNTGSEIRNTDTDTSPDTDPDTAAARAERGASAWQDAVRLQRWATPAHSDFSALGCELVATLYAVEDLAQVLHRQVGRYQRDQQQAGQAVYDDTREMDPAERLQVAAIALTELRDAAASAEFWANAFWSAIGHIGVEDPPRPTATDVLGELGSSDGGQVRS
jgi:hypothetical protein